MKGEPNEHDERESVLQDGSSKPHNLPLEYLRNITDNFSEERLLGKGAFGKVYKGVLQNGEMIAVKKLASSIQGDEGRQFENEAKNLMSLKHQNIVLLVGCCTETENKYVEYNGNYVCAEQPERLLCLEFMPRGSLRGFLSDESSGLEWETRYQIIEGICYGLHYLHEEVNTPIIHMDLKPENILLDNNMVPKIADFGLSRIFSEEKTWICTRSQGGTLGYMAPEYIDQGVISKKSDIFSLGVIITEIMTGHRGHPSEIGTSSQEFIKHSREFIGIVHDNWKNRLEKAPGYATLEIDCQRIRRCIQISLNCMRLRRAIRPTTSQIIKMLHGSESAECSNGEEITGNQTEEGSAASERGPCHQAEAEENVEFGGMAAVFGFAVIICLSNESKHLGNAHLILTMLMCFGTIVSGLLLLLLSMSMLAFEEKVVFAAQRVAAKCLRTTSAVLLVQTILLSLLALPPGRVYAELAMVTVIMLVAVRAHRYLTRGEAAAYEERYEEDLDTASKTTSWAMSSALGGLIGMLISASKILGVAAGAVDSAAYTAMFFTSATSITGMLVMTMSTKARGVTDPGWRRRIITAIRLANVFLFCWLACAALAAASIILRYRVVAALAPFVTTTIVCFLHWHHVKSFGYIRDNLLEETRLRVSKLMMATQGVLTSILCSTLSENVGGKDVLAVCLALAFTAICGVVLMAMLGTARPRAHSAPAARVLPCSYIFAAAAVAVYGVDHAKP